MAEQKEKLSWVQWKISDAQIYREILNNEQMGELFFAVMKTFETNEQQEVSAELKIPYLQRCVHLKNVRAKYTKKCEINAMNGSKGGKAKAAKAKAKAEEEAEAKAEEDAEVKPPTITKFRQMAKHICKKYDFERDAYEIDSLFDILAKNNWRILGKSIFAKSYLFEAAIFANLATCGKYHEIFYSLISKYDDIDIDTLETIDEWYNPYEKLYRTYNGKTFTTTADVTDYYATEYHEYLRQDCC